MKKWMFGFVSILLTIGLLAGCASGQENETEAPADTAEQNTTEEATTEESEETVVITISENNGEEVITEESVAIEEGDLLLDVMEENFEVEHSDGFITSIDGVAPEEGEERSWMYFVNGEMAMVGAAEYELEADDEVVFDLQAWE